MESEQMIYYLTVQSPNVVALGEFPCIAFPLLRHSFYRSMLFFQALTDQRQPTKQTSQHPVVAAPGAASILSPFVFYWSESPGDAALHRSDISCHFLCSINAAQLQKSPTNDFSSSFASSHQGRAARWAFHKSHGQLTKTFVKEALHVCNNMLDCSLQSVSQIAKGRRIKSLITNNLPVIRNPSELWTKYNVGDVSWGYSRVFKVSSCSFLCWGFLMQFLMQFWRSFC